MVRYMAKNQLNRVPKTNPRRIKMEEYNKKFYEIGKKEERLKIVTKLLKRANYFLKNVTSVDSPMILIATELKIQADEIQNSSYDY